MNKLTDANSQAGSQPVSGDVNWGNTSGVANAPLLAHNVDPGRNEMNARMLEYMLNEQQTAGFENGSGGVYLLHSSAEFDDAEWVDPASQGSLLGFSGRPEPASGPPLRSLQQSNSLGSIGSLGSLSMMNSSQTNPEASRLRTTTQGMSGGFSAHDPTNQLAAQMRAMHMGSLNASDLAEVMPSSPQALQARNPAMVGFPSQLSNNSNSNGFNQNSHNGSGGATNSSPHGSRMMNTVAPLNPPSANGRPLTATSRMLNAQLQMLQQQQQQAHQQAQQQLAQQAQQQQQQQQVHIAAQQMFQAQAAQQFNSLASLSNGPSTLGDQDDPSSMHALAASLLLAQQQAVADADAAAGVPTPLLQAGGIGASSSLYVKNLPPETNELWLYRTFAPIGPLISCKVHADPVTGACKGVAFVNYADTASALRALQQLHGKLIAGGRAMHITLQAPRAVRAAAQAAAHHGHVPTGSAGTIHMM